MRAKTIKKKAYVWDFDDTLVKTEAKVHVLVNGRRVKSITPTEYNTYSQQPGETFDMSDFTDPRFILAAKKYKLWPALENVANAKKMGRSESDIYILTARSDKAQIPIHTFLKRNGVDIPLDNIFTVGNDKGLEYDIAAEKRKILTALTGEYDVVYFFDDSEENVNLAKNIPGIKTRLVDWNK